MALNIAITSKYNPFTYEDYIKPLEGYWEDYDKYEEDLAKLSTDLGTMRSVVNTMSDGEEKTKYTNYLSDLDKQATSLSLNGLTSENRQALRDLKTKYSELIPRLALAEEARRKDLADYTKRVNSGEYFMYNDSPLNKNVVAYLDGNLPTYNAGLNKQLFGQEVENVAKAYSNRIFNDVDVQEVEKIGRKFLKLTEEKGINTDLSDIEGSEQFSPILEELYAEAGVNNMNQTEAAKTKDFINRKFWEGLVYQKNVSLQQGKYADADSAYEIIGQDENGNTIIRSGNKHFVVDPNNRIIGETSFDGSDNNKADGRESFSSRIFGFDQWRKKNIEVIGKEDTFNESWTKSPSTVVENYINTVSGSPSVESSTSTNILNSYDPATLLQKVRAKVTGDTDKKLFDKYRTVNNSMFLGAGSYVGKTENNNKGEFIGDNHIINISVDEFFNQLDSKQLLTSTLYHIYENIWSVYGDKPKHEARNRVLKAAKDAMTFSENGKTYWNTVEIKWLKDNAPTLYNYIYKSSTSSVQKQLESIIQDWEQEETLETGGIQPKSSNNED